MSLECEHRSLELVVSNWTIHCTNCKQVPYSEIYMYDLLIKILLDESWPKDELLLNEITKRKRITNLYKRNKEEQIYIIDNDLELIFIAIDRTLQLTKDPSIFKDRILRLNLVEIQLKRLKLRINKKKSIGIITRKEFEGLGLLHAAQQQFLRFIPHNKSIVPFTACISNHHKYHLGHESC